MAIWRTFQQSEITPGMVVRKSLGANMFPFDDNVVLTVDHDAAEVTLARPMAFAAEVLPTKSAMLYAEVYGVSLARLAAEYVAYCSEKEHAPFWLFTK